MKDKIITIIPSLYDGGAEKLAADLSFSLMKSFDHSIIIYNKNNNKYDFTGELIELNIPSKSFILSRLRRQFLILKNIIYLKNKLQPKVVISHLLMANLLNILSKKNHKTVCVIHGEWSIKSGKSKFLDFFIRKYYAKTDIIVSVSNHIKQTFDDYYKLKTQHLVIYNGIDVNNVKEKAKETIAYNLPDKYFVYVAGFRNVKNHILLLNQLGSYLKNNSYILVLVGDGPLKSKIEKRIKELGLMGKVVLLGNLPNPYPVMELSLIHISEPTRR
ncbi:MAG: glycosyltransferase, partial [Bacteroidetes bacterium]|nr:glycosyltransferase [Bacteroidota bacterium]